MTLATWLDVPVQELGYGMDNPQRVSERPKPWHADRGYQDRELFEIYLRLPVPKRRLARDVILAIARAHQAEEDERAAC